MICSLTLNSIVEHTAIGSYRRQHHSWFVDISIAAFILIKLMAADIDYWLNAKP